MKLRMNSVKKNKELLADLSASLFWDVERKTIDCKKHAPYIVSRVLGSGTMQDFKTIKALYGKSKLKQIALQLRYMDDRALSFCSAYFNTPVKNFRCYTTKQLNPTYWNY